MNTWPTVQNGACNQNTHVCPQQVSIHLCLIIKITGIDINYLNSS